MDKTDAFVMMILAFAFGGVGGWFFINAYAKGRRKLINKTNEAISDWKWKKIQEAKKAREKEND